MNQIYNDIRMIVREELERVKEMVNEAYLSGFNDGASGFRFNDDYYNDIKKALEE